MNSDEHGIFAQANYYDLALPRDFSRECDFLAWCADRHGTCADRSFVELGCGPARHAREMARRGYRAVGVDLADPMLSFARAEAEREGLALELVCADMTEFSLPRAVGLAACLIETICCVLTNEAMLRHLRTVAGGLLPGGVYVLETTHPRKAWTPPSGVPHVGRRGETEVELLWGVPGDPHDSIAQVSTITRMVTVKESGHVVARYEDTTRQRYYMAQELRALVELAGCFAELHFYGRLGLPPLPLSDDPACEDMVAVLVKGR